MKNLLFYGTTNYGESLNSSNVLKFKELSKNFSTFVMTYGDENKTIEHDYVTIDYIRKPNNLISKYLKFYFLNFNHLKSFCEEQNIDITFVEDSDSDYERVKEQYNQGQLIKVQVPIRLTKKIKNRPSKKILPIDVYLKKRSPGKGKLAFVLRAFLNISGEDAKIINNGYDIIAITKISDDDISIFCGTIENPAHTQFSDIDNDKATNNFQLIKDTRSYIRNAPYLAFQLFENLSQKEVIDDFMSNVFGIALPVIDSSINKRKKKKKKSTKTEPVKILVPENDIANELDIQEVHVINDEIVEKGQLLFTLANRGQIIEVLAPCRGKILSIFCSVGDKVTVHQLLGEIKKMALVEPPILEQIGFEPFIIKGTGKCLLSNLPLMIEVTATSNSLNKLREPLESSENGFLDSKVSNALGCELINRQRDSISIEINSPDFHFELDKFDARFSTTFSIKY